MQTNESIKMVRRRNVFQAAKALSSWLGVQALTTRTIEETLANLKAGFEIKSKDVPYLILSQLFTGKYYIIKLNVLW